jgi:hypothetical protein
MTFLTICGDHMQYLQFVKNDMQGMQAAVVCAGPYLCLCGYNWIMENTITCLNTGVNIVHVTIVIIKIHEMGFSNKF